MFQKYMPVGGLHQRGTKWPSPALLYFLFHKCEQGPKTEHSNLSQPLSYHSWGNSTSNVFQEFQITSVLHPHHTFLTNSNNGFHHSLGHNLHVYVKCAVDLSILGEWSELYLWSSGQISDVWWNEWQHSQGLNLKSFIGNQFLINLFTKIAYLHLAHVLLT